MLPELLLGSSINELYNSYLLAIWICNYGNGAIWRRNNVRDVDLAAERLKRKTSFTALLPKDKFVIQ